MIPETLVKRSRMFRDLATVALVSVTALAVHQHLVVPYQEIAGEAAAAATGRSDPYRNGYLMGRYVTSVVEALPAIFYLFALWEARRIFAGLAEGRLFQETVVRGVGGVGRYLTLGSLAVIALGLIVPRSGAVAAFGHVNTLVPTVVTLLIGAALNIVSRLLKRAAVMEAELEQII